MVETGYKYLAEIYVANENLTRQTGKTTALIEACRKIGGIFVAHSSSQVNILKREYPDVDIISPSLFKLKGKHKPLIFDHYLLSLILSDKLCTSIRHQGTIYLQKQLFLIKQELANRLLSELRIGVKA